MQTNTEAIFSIEIYIMTFSCTHAEKYRKELFNFLNSDIYIFLKISKWTKSKKKNERKIATTIHMRSESIHRCHQQSWSKIQWKWRRKYWDVCVGSRPPPSVHLLPSSPVVHYAHSIILNRRKIFCWILALKRF